MSEAGSPLELPFGPCSVAVFAPSPVVTITVEAGSESEPDIHLHAGGQGFWVARMAARLGAKVSLCVPLGGESGTVLRSLLAVDGISRPLGRDRGPRTAPTSTIDAAAVGWWLPRRPVRRLTRHELDDLYGVTLAAGMESDVALITGARNPGILSAEVYERLCRDLSDQWADGRSRPQWRAADGGSSGAGLTSSR